MPLNLPLRPSLDRLRRQAKDLLRAVRAQSSTALQRLAVFFPGSTPETAQLNQAQTVLAREYGFPSWRTLLATATRRLARLGERAARANARRQDAAALAGSWFELAERNDLDGLWRALTVAKHRLEAARPIMQADSERYDRFLAVLIGGLSHDNPRLRFEYAHALDSFGDARCIEPLRQLMKDEVPRVRWMAMHALTCHACNPQTCSSDPELISEIARYAQSDSSIKVRQHATVALGLSGYRPMEPVVRDILATATDRRLKHAAEYSLRALAG